LDARRWAAIGRRNFGVSVVVICWARFALRQGIRAATTPDGEDQSEMSIAMSTLFHRKSWTTDAVNVLDEERLRIGAVLAYLKEHGNVDGFPARQNERMALMATAERRGLIAWDRSHERYGVTRLGESALAPYSPLEIEAAMPPRGSKPLPNHRSVRRPSSTILAFAAGAACMGLASWIFAGSGNTMRSASVPLSTGSPAATELSASSKGGAEVAPAENPPAVEDHPTTAGLAPIMPEPQQQDEGASAPAASKPVAAQEAIKPERDAVSAVPAQGAGKQHQVPAAGRGSAAKPSARSQPPRRIDDAQSAAPKRKARRARAYAYDRRYRSRRNADREPVVSEEPDPLFGTRAPLGFGRVSREPPPPFAPSGPGPDALGWLFR
jgi:hypothetical protein